MSAEHDREQLDRDQDREGVEPQTSAQPAQRQLLGAERARAAIEGNDDYRLQFEADPVSFMQRFRAGAPAGRGAAAPAAPTSAPTLIPATIGSTPAGSRADVKVGNSPIHGQGIFSGPGVRSGEVLGKVMNAAGDDVSPMASKVNNSDRPNAMPVMQGGELVLQAVRDVPAGQEVLSNYPFPKG